MIIGLVGLGEIGAEIGRYFVKNGIEVISVYGERSKISQDRAIKYGIKDVLTIENVSQKSDIIISIIPPNRALETADQYSKYISKDGPIYCDLNAISTMTAKKIKALLD